MRLINKSYKSYTKVSRYNNFPYYYDTVNNKYVYGITAHLDNTTAYTNYTVVHGDTYDSIALKYYNNPTYFWIICSFNRIQDPYIPPEEGTQIKVPSISPLRFLD